MKKLFFFVALVCALTACRSDIDLGKVDTKMEVDLGLALPVGDIKMMLTDMLGDVDGLYIDSKGVLTWEFDTTTARDYHKMDLAQYISKANIKLKVYDQIAEKYPYLVGLSIPLPYDFPVALDFPLDLPLTGINEDKTIKERLDSAIIEEASFYSIIRPESLPFEWDWVDSIVLDLGPRFSRPAGNHMVIYTKDESVSYGYGDSIPLMVDKFTLNMMKKTGNLTPLEYKFNNVYDTCSFNVHFKFTIPKNSVISLNSNSAINYELGARFLNFSAIWGMFEPASSMSGENVIDMSDAWKSFDFLTKATMPFSEPVINTQIVTHVAGALRLKNSYLFTLDANNDTTFAEFSDTGDPSTWKWFSRTFDQHEYLPLNSAIGDSSVNMYVTFDKTVKGGQIHKMFRKTPQQLGYKFAVIFDEMETPQIRITPNTAIRINSSITMPFIFDQGVWIEYPQNADVNLSQVSIDSIQASAEAIDTIKSAKVKLVMKALNSIPLNLKYTMLCLDAKGDTIKDPLDPTKNFMLFSQDTINLVPPTFTFNAAAGGWVTTPRESVFVVELTKEQLNVFPKIAQIAYTAVLDDDALDEAYSQGLPNVRLTNQDYVVMKIGLAASVQGVVNFGTQNVYDK